LTGNAAVIQRFDVDAVHRQEAGAMAQAWAEKSRGGWVPSDRDAIQFDKKFKGAVYEFVCMDRDACNRQQIYR
jgi:hypothetical protein